MQNKNFRSSLEEIKGQSFQSFDLLKTRNKIIPIKNNTIEVIKKSSSISSIYSDISDTDKQENFSMKKSITGTNTSLPSLPIIKKVNKVNKINRVTHYININKKLTNDLNFQIDTMNKKILNNLFAYKHTINLQEINDYLIYEKTKKNIAEHKKKGEKSTIDFTIPIAYRRINNHFKKEDLIPIKMKPKINLEDVLYMHNSIFRKSMTQNKCKNYYLKNSLKLINNYMRNKGLNNNKTFDKIKRNKNILFNNRIGLK